MTHLSHISCRWKKMQQCVQRGVVIMPIMVTQDEAMIDGNNRRSLIPVYATLGWIRAKWRNAKWARVLLGYLPSLKEEELPNVSDSRCRAIKRQLHKAAMQKILRPLKKTMGKGAIAVIVTNTSSVTTYWSYQVCRCTCPVHTASGTSAQLFRPLHLAATTIPKQRKLQG